MGVNVLMLARVLQFEIIRALTIVLEREGQWKGYSTISSLAYLAMNVRHSFSRRKIFSKDFTK